MLQDPESTFNTDFKTITCKFCLKTGQLEPNGKSNPMHGYGVRCSSCKRDYGWGGKIKKLRDENGIRNKSSVWSAERLGISYCQYCLRDKAFIGESENLEVHHIIPIEDNGKDEISNIWVLCTACHKELHHHRTYHNHHLSKFFKAYQSIQRLKESGEIPNE